MDPLNLDPDPIPTLIRIYFPHFFPLNEFKGLLSDNCNIYQNILRYTGLLLKHRRDGPYICAWCYAIIIE